MAGALPDPRDGATIVPGIDGGSILTFGGDKYPYDKGECRFKDDTWELHLGSTAFWTKLAPPTVPRGRQGGAGLLKAATGRLLVFGGINWCPPICEGAELCDQGLNDLWSLDPQNPASGWRREHPLGQIPAARWGFQSAFVPSTGMLVIQGGLNYSSDLVGDTWTLDVSGPRPAWTRIADHQEGPAERATAFHWYDSDRRAFVVTSGRRCFKGQCDAVWWTDTWMLTGLDTPGKESWSQVAVGTGLPWPAFGLKCAYDPRGGRAICHGGRYYSGGPLDSTGVPSLDTWSVRFTGERTLVFELVDTGGTKPTASVMDLHYDAPRDRFLVFGGWTGNPPGPSYKTVNEVWVLEREPGCEDAPAGLWERP